jgi:hypothetical protein
MGHSRRSQAAIRCIETHFGRHPLKIQSWKPQNCHAEVKMSGARDLFQAANQLYRSKAYSSAIEAFRSALNESPTAGWEMLIRSQLALVIWDQAGLEPEGKVYSITRENIVAAEASMRLWTDVVNIYHKRVKNDPEELRLWPHRQYTPLEVCKDALGAAERAHSAVVRVRRSAGQ